MTPRPVILIVTATLAAGMLLCLGLVGWLAAHAQAIPDVLVTVTGGLVGAMSTVLVRTGSDETPERPTPVEVVNTPHDPVPTTDTEG